MAWSHIAIEDIKNVGQMPLQCNVNLLTVNFNRLVDREYFELSKTGSEAMTGEVRRRYERRFKQMTSKARS